MKDERNRMMITLNDETFEKVKELADRMKVPASTMAAWLLEASVEDNEYFIKLVTSRFAENVRAAFGRKTKRKQ